MVSKTQPPCTVKGLRTHCNGHAHWRRDLRVRSRISRRQGSVTTPVAHALLFPTHMALLCWIGKSSVAVCKKGKIGKQDKERAFRTGCHWVTESGNLFQRSYVDVRICLKPHFEFCFPPLSWTCVLFLCMPVGYITRSDIAYKHAPQAFASHVVILNKEEGCTVCNLHNLGSYPNFSAVSDCIKRRVIDWVSCWFVAF
jgi:hypothetical protein